MKTMPKLLLMLAGALAACSSTRERAVALEQLPAQAQASLRAQAAGAPITRVVEKCEGAQRQYEAQWKVGESLHEATVTAAGELVETEAELPSAQVPAPVRTAAEAALPKNAEIAYEKKTEVASGAVIYSAEAKVCGHMRELEFSPDGKPVTDADRDAD